MRALIVAGVQQPMALGFTQSLLLPLARRNIVRLVRQAQHVLRRQLGQDGGGDRLL